MLNQNKVYLWLLLIFISSQASAQSGPPPTDIYLLTMKVGGEQLKLTSAKNITHRDGYDNQPLFLPDGKRLLYTSIREDGQADIYRYDLHSGTTTRLTHTKESEYSPTPMPDGRHFSVVRVEADSTQRLWKFPFAGGEPALVVEDVQPVGYHAWGSADEVALYVLGNPNGLYIANIQTGKSERLIDSIGRSLHRIADRDAFSFVHKVSEKEWWIKEVTLRDHKITPLIQTLEGSEDYAWTPSGTLLMGNSSTLYKWHPAKDKDWVEAADLKEYGIKAITRLAVSPLEGKLALVSSR